jgi:hypothetical protein
VPKTDSGYVVEREKAHLTTFASSLQSARKLLKSSREACSLDGFFDTVMELCTLIHDERSMITEEAMIVLW